MTNDDYLDKINDVLNDIKNRLEKYTQHEDSTYEELKENSDKIFRIRKETRERDNDRDWFFVDGYLFLDFRRGMLDFTPEYREQMINKLEQETEEEIKKVISIGKR